MSGRVVHFEIPYDDGDRARSFYKEAFDWQLVTMPEMGGYTLVMSGPSGDEEGPSEPGFINGGMLSRSDAATSGPVDRRRRTASIDESLREDHRPRRGAASSRRRRRSATWASPPT